MKPLTLHTATIPINTALSQAICLDGRGIDAIQMPAGWDAAVITLSVSQDNDTYVPLRDVLANEVTLQAAASVGIQVEPASIYSAYGWKWLKIRSGTVSSAVNQTAARSLVISLKPL